MMLSWLDNALWAAGLIGHVALALVLFIRRRAFEVPVLTAFACFSAVRTLVLLGLYRFGSKHSYFLGYWLTGGLDYLFQVALISEIARGILRPAGRWVIEARKLFLVFGTAGIVLSGLFALRIGPPQSRGLDLWDTRITVFTSLITCELFIAMSFAANRLGLRRRCHLVAFGQGLFAWGFCALLENLGHTILGWNREFVILDHLRMLVYLLVLVYWMKAFWRDDQVRGAFPLEKEALLAETKKALESRQHR